MGHRRLLVIGNGSIARLHVRLSRQLLPDADIRVLRYRLDREISPYASGALSTIDEVSAFEPEYVIIASPAPWHVEQAKRILRKNTNLLIEKPLSDSANKAVELLRFSETTILVGYNLRLSASLQYFRKLVHKRLVGNILNVRCEVGQYLPAWRPDTPVADSVSVSRSLGGGVLLELSHEIDYLTWIFGEVLSVNASLLKQTNLVNDVEDFAHLLITSDCKFALKPLPISLQMDMYRHDSTRYCLAICEDGSLKWDGVSGKVELLSRGNAQPEILFAESTPHENTYLAQLGVLFGSSKSTRTYVATGKDGLAVLEVIEAARISSERGGKNTRISRSSL